ncbi:MAG: O-antigen ligase family protein [Alphaproteobacteria bacterium]|nr:O-antigen ligase family protein [Alphaproteobacteria bacterium]
MAHDVVRDAAGASIADDLARDADGAPLTKPRFQFGVMDGVFVALLLLAFVGVQPFAIRNPATDLQTGPYQVTGGGDAFRQAIYLLVFFSVAGFAVMRRGIGILSTVPPLLAMLLGWCLLSALWAAAPDVALRRAGLAIVVALSTMLSVDALGPERALRIWKIVLACVLIVNWASIGLVHQSVHLPGEQDPGLVGDWRGLYFHKNIAGAVSAITAIVFFFSWLRTKHWSDIAIFLLALGFTAMSHSKSSLGLLPLAIGFGLAYRFAWRTTLDRSIVAVAGVLVLFLLAAAVALNADTLAQMLEDPTEFTGRSAIWAAELAFARDHMFLGSGFGTFADTGSLSPLHNYVAGSWVEAVAHGHSGYLQILVTIGGVGLLLTVLATVAAPARRFWKMDGADLDLKGMLLALFVFFVLHNFMESDFLEGDAPAWVSFLIMLALLYRLPRRA